MIIGLERVDDPQLLGGADAGEHGDPVDGGRQPPRRLRIVVFQEWRELAPACRPTQQDGLALGDASEGHSEGHPHHPQLGEQGREIRELASGMLQRHRFNLV